MMERRAFLAVVLALSGCGRRQDSDKLAAEVVPEPAATPPPPQPPRPKMPRIALLSAGTRPAASVAPAATGHGIFRSHLRELGHVEGKTILVDERYADEDAQRLPRIAHDIAGGAFDIIVTFGPQAAAAAAKATNAVPIVMVNGGDPVASGLVKSLARPGGNLTGTASGTMEVGVRQLELLRELLPGITRLGVLVNPTNAANAAQLASVTRHARRVGIGVVDAELSHTADLDRAFNLMREARPDALMVPTDPVIFANGMRVLAFATANRLPAIYGLAEMAYAGGLMSYSPVLRTQFAEAAKYVDKILKGAKPGDMPISQPMQFELIINLRAAKAIGVTIPRQLALKAEIVE